MNTGEWMTANKIDKWILNQSRPGRKDKADPDDEATIIGIQQAEATAELEAAKKVVVNLFRDETTGEIYQFCRECFEGFENNHRDNLTYIDKAGDWDICDYCEAQNIPTYYHGEI